jgi:hypothetical protein
VPDDLAHDAELRQRLDEVRALLHREQRQREALPREKARLRERVALLEAELRQLRAQVSRPPPRKSQPRAPPGRPSMAGLALVGVSGFVFSVLEAPLAGAALLAAGLGLCLGARWKGPR